MITKDKKYLITGGTGVIGYSLCKRIISMGGHVIVLSRSETKLNKLIEKTQFKNYKYLVAFPNVQLVDSYDELEGFDSI